MKTRNAMQLKALVNNYAVANNLIPQIVLQNYHLQRFMERLVTAGTAASSSSREGFFFPPSTASTTGRQWTSM